MNGDHFVLMVLVGSYIFLFFKCLGSHVTGDVEVDDCARAIRDVVKVGSVW